MAQKTTLKNEIQIALAQLNPVVGDIEGNLALARLAYQEACSRGADILLFTELFICGYPPEDLVLKPAFIAACERAIAQLAEATRRGGPAMIIGTPLCRDGAIYNAVVLLAEGRILSARYKHDLPNYGQFDEKRVFSAGPLPDIVEYRGFTFAMPVCEDIWNDRRLSHKLAQQGAEFLFVANASPYSQGKLGRRQKVVEDQVKTTGCPVVYANQVGGQDELVFDGGSFALQADGKYGFQMKQFESQLAFSKWQKIDNKWICYEGVDEPLYQGDGADYCACVLGFADYVEKNKFKDVVLGLSGGIDSALCAAIAVDALGAPRVRAVMLPYHYTSQQSFKDAEECAKALGCRYETVPISAPVEGFLQALQPLFTGIEPGVTEENLQSRTRGTLLMAISNKFGSMVVTTGNKSEMAVGYATLYGDMNGGFNPIKDVYKTQVYTLSQWRNDNWHQTFKGPKSMVIPRNIIDKAPSAELRDNQKDQDTLPPYEILDDILKGLVEDDMALADLVKRGHDKVTVERIEKLLYLAEYKRYQSAPGVKISSKNFDRDRRYPITNRFLDRE